MYDLDSRVCLRLSGHVKRFREPDLHALTYVRQPTAVYLLRVVCTDQQHEQDEGPSLTKATTSGQRRPGRAQLISRGCAARRVPVQGDVSESGL
ncbi:unnamed protein product [Trichogramma brassicae]|uniref:Uncharacterized protein n=1 Tax=Trichogramma brassicae TaxID=86971 RepID=A0A6H5J1J9_9HYME|nr:unnamed protein product [Trichogramma brassicae]